MKLQPGQFFRQPVARGGDFAEVRLVIIQVVQGRLGGDLAQPVHAVTVAERVQRRDQFRMTDEITDPLEAERIGFGEGTGHDDVGMFQRQTQRVFWREIHVGFIQHHHAFEFRAERVELRGRVPPAAGRIGRGDEGQRRLRETLLEMPHLPRLGQGEFPTQRQRVGGGAVQGGEHRIQRVTGREKLDGRLDRRDQITLAHRPALARQRLHETTHRQRQQFITTVANDDVLDPAAVPGGQFFAQPIRPGIRIQAQASVHRGFDGFEHPRRGRIRVLIGVQLDETRRFWLFARHIGLHIPQDRTHPLFWIDRRHRAH
ncbi:MAG: hypothetical protein BWX84_02380 [Verrucomicrobia bacterium ADurb.Bin118]|nr:MAG: hypothetical protein BWX84_02380 [Verrucomicrobia bacterium ADurb.Bin118]